MDRRSVGLVGQRGEPGALGEQQLAVLDRDGHSARKDTGLS